MSNPTIVPDLHQATLGEVWDHVNEAASRLSLGAPRAVNLYRERLDAVVQMETREQARAWAAWLGIASSERVTSSGVWYDGRLYGWSWGVHWLAPSGPSPRSHLSAAAPRLLAEAAA